IRSDRKSASYSILSPQLSESRFFRARWTCHLPANTCELPRVANALRRNCSKNLGKRGLPQEAFCEGIVRAPFAGRCLPSLATFPATLASAPPRATACRFKTCAFATATAATRHIQAPPPPAKPLPDRFFRNQK